MVLNNPVWHALNSGNISLAKGNNRVRYLDIEVSPFIALRENTGDNLKLLYDMIAPERLAILASPTIFTIPAQWKTIACVHGYQMLHNGITVEETSLHATTTLTTAHCVEMVALAKLTNPGPFAIKTIEFGHYEGIFSDGKLAAMAGQRMHAFNYAEISAVCTHPDDTGKGFARQLLIHQISRIMANNEIPYLHVKHDNKRAIDLYLSLGFSVRSDMYFYILTK